MGYLRSEKLCSCGETIMKKYVNEKTGAILEIASQLSGGDWKEVKEKSKPKRKSKAKAKDE